MNDVSAKRPARRLAVPIVLLVALAAAVVVFHGPLVAWFTGKPMGGGEGAPVTVQAGPLSMSAALEPDPPRQAEQALVLVVTDAGGRPIDGATVGVTYDMPAMGAMAEMKGEAKVSPEPAGRYRAVFSLPVAGTWTLTASIRSPVGAASQDFAMTVGRRGLQVGNGTGGMNAMDGGTSTDGAAPPVEIDHYTCSMHPSVHEAAPGACPICGMTLVPVPKEQKEQGVVVVPEVRRQIIGVRTAPVVEAPMHWTFRALGRVAYDEAALSDVTLKVRGWITKLYVDETGQRVSRGQTLFTLYSPELYDAEQDLLLAARAATTTATAPTGHPMLEGSHALAGAARQRLRLLGLEDAQIDAIAQKGAPSESVAFPSPASGFVIEKDVVQGAAVEPGARLYRIAALDRVWIEADVYEADFAHVRVGQRATITLDYLPGRAYEAKVAYVYPYLDAKTRTGRVRIELANEGLGLRPGMFANVELSADLGKRVQVPASAIVYTGPRRLVFVDLGQGRLQPTEIQVGSEADGMVEVLSGLCAGQTVATSGVFLIAAEARIRTAATYWEPTEQPSDAGPTMPKGSR